MILAESSVDKFSTMKLIVVLLCVCYASANVLREKRDADVEMTARDCLTAGWFCKFELAGLVPRPYNRQEFLNNLNTRPLRTTCRQLQEFVYCQQSVVDNEQCRAHEAVQRFVQMGQGVSAFLNKLCGDEFDAVQNSLSCFTNEVVIASVKTCRRTHINPDDCTNDSAFWGCVRDVMSNNCDSNANALFGRLQPTMQGMRPGCAENLIRGLIATRNSGN